MRWRSRKRLATTLDISKLVKERDEADKALEDFRKENGLVFGESDEIYGEIFSQDETHNEEFEQLKRKLESADAELAKV